MQKNKKNRNHPQIQHRNKTIRFWHKQTVRSSPRLNHRRGSAKWKSITGNQINEKKRKITPLAGPSSKEIVVETQERETESSWTTVVKGSATNAAAGRREIDPPPSHYPSWTHPITKTRQHILSPPPSLSFGQSTQRREWAGQPGVEGMTDCMEIQKTDILEVKEIKDYPHEKILKLREVCKWL